MGKAADETGTSGQKCPKPKQSFRKKLPCVQPSRRPGAPCSSTEPSCRRSTFSVPPYGSHCVGVPEMGQGHVTLGGQRETYTHTCILGAHSAGGTTTRCAWNAAPWQLSPQGSSLIVRRVIKDSCVQVRACCLAELLPCTDSNRCANRDTETLPCLSRTCGFVHRVCGGSGFWVLGLACKGSRKISPCRRIETCVDLDWAGQSRQQERGPTFSRSGCILENNS